MNNLPTLSLEPIVLSDNASWWPLAIGWWLILALMVLIPLLSFCVYRYYQQHWRYRKQALKLLNQYYRQWQNDQQPEAMIHSALTLLRRTAITAYGHSDIVSLTGKEWCEFLQQQTRRPVFDSSFFQLVTVEQYQKNPDTDIVKLYQQVSRWIRQHRRSETEIVSHVKR